MNSRQGLRIATAVFFFLLATSPLFADGVVRDSVGAISSGRGGTNLGFSDNGAILLNNPAGMVNIRGTRLSDVNVDLLMTDLSYADPLNSRAAKTRLQQLPALTYIQKSEDSLWAAGIGVYVPAGFGAQWSMQNAIMGRNRYESFDAVMKILPGIAFHVTDKLAIGANFGVAISHADLESPFFLQTGPLAGTPTLFNLQATGVAPTWGVGMQYELDEKTTFGFAYSSSTSFDLSGNVTTDIFGLGPAPVHSRFDLDMEMTWPSSLGFGVKHQLTDRQTVSLDLVWFNWSDAFDKIDMRLSNPSNPLVQGLVGRKLRDALALDWKDSISVRLGYELQLTCCDVLRLGYIHNSITTPSSTLTPLIPATLEHTFTIGYGKSLGSCRWDLAYQYAFGPTRRVTTSEIVGGDFNFSKVKSDTHWLMLSYTQNF
ncbi:MAG: outer membrane protein transport protein [Planctomycetaceae bacterium]